MFHFTKRLVLAGLALLLAVPIASAQWREDYPVLRLGVVTGPNTAYGRARVEPFRSYLEQRLGVSVEVATAVDYASLIGDQLIGRYHATFLSAAAFAAASAACSACVEPLVAPTTVEGEIGFYAVLLVTPGSAIADLEGLDGARLAVSTDDSLAGRLLPLALFAEAGVDLENLELISSRNPVAAVGRLLDGAADAALAWTSLSGDSSTGYSRGVLTQMIADGVLTMDEVVIVWTSPLIPHGPLAVLTNLPADLKSELSAAMIEMNTAAPDALAVINALGGGFVAAAADLYQPLLLLADPATLPR